MGKKKQKSRKEDKKSKDSIKKKGKKGGKTAKASDKKKATKKSKKDRGRKSKSSAAKQPQPHKISSEERLEMIRTAAYYLAQKRSYPGESELDDWITAEKNIDRMISRIKD